MRPQVLFDADEQYRKKGIHKELEVPSQGQNLAKIRAFVEGLAKDCGFSDAEVFEVKVAVGEACANAIEHGSPEGASTSVRIICDYTDKCLEIEVEDKGVFKPRFPDFNSQLNYGGRGIPFMLALMDKVEIKESAEGTTVRLVKCRA